MTHTDSSYCSQHYNYLGGAINLPASGSTGGHGSSSDVDDWYHNSGPKWDNFFWFQWDNTPSSPPPGYAPTSVETNLVVWP